MKETILKQIPCSQFLARLNRDALFEGFCAIWQCVSRINASYRQSGDGG
jgi:hypothetical protein